MWQTTGVSSTVRGAMSELNVTDLESLGVVDALSRLNISVSIDSVLRVMLDPSRPEYAGPEGVSTPRVKG